jgi:hypothetical protein
MSEIRLVPKPDVDALQICKTIHAVVEGVSNPALRDNLLEHLAALLARVLSPPMIVTCEPRVVRQNEF